MKRFSFPLEGYLKLKRLKEKEKLTELSELTFLRQKHQREREHSIQEIERLLQEEREESQLGQFTLEKALLRRYYFTSLRKKARLHETKIADLEAPIKEKEEAWKKARQERRSLENLKEHRYQAYLYELSRQESKDLDEFNLRNARGGRLHGQS
ncbi:MAG: flagellar export protein FliJ [Leptospiraceae bacterium]|nr:flagellar export protein FliJ [Leptospiraceae bacterium]MDW8305974.1 flagellar export protein FliJ [Leptospiraceae bacterium]